MFADGSCRRHSVSIQKSVPLGRAMLCDNCVGVALKMKPQPVTWTVWAGALVLAAFILAAFGVLLFQGLYWLRFDQWYDWTAPDGPRFVSAGTQGAHRQGIEEISVWMSSAPMELWTFAAAFILLLLFTLAGIFGRR